MCTKGTVMKKLIPVLFLFCSGLLFAQGNAVTVGILGTRFTNNSTEFRLSETKDPIGMGIIAGYLLNKTVALGVTAEYFSGNHENNSVNNEKALRTGLSVFAFPAAYKNLRLFVSGGLINTVRFSDNNGTTESFDFLNARFSAGLDFSILPGLSVMYDAGIYTNGWNTTGSSHSLGLRYTAVLVK